MKRYRESSAFCLAWYICWSRHLDKSFVVALASCPHSYALSTTVAFGFTMASAIAFSSRYTVGGVYLRLSFLPFSIIQIPVPRFISQIFQDSLDISIYCARHFSVLFQCFSKESLEQHDDGTTLRTTTAFLNSWCLALRLCMAGRSRA